MKTTLLFLVFLSASSYGLWSWGQREEAAPDLPGQDTQALPAAILNGSELRDEFGNQLFSGSLRALEDVVLRVMHEGHVRYYIRLQRVGRGDGQPRLEDVSCAVFDAPKDGKPQLRAMFRAPYVSADLAALLRGGAQAPKSITLTGRVRALDPQGNVLAETEWVRLDVESKRVSSDGVVTLRQPDKDLELTGRGFDAQMDLRSATLRKDIRVSTPTLRATAGGPAHLRQVADGDPLDVEVLGDVEVTHETGSLRGSTLHARFSKRDKRYELQHATVEGDVLLTLAGDVGRGLKVARLPRVRIVSRHRLVAAGPVHATWRGEIAALGLGEREIEIKAGRVEIDADGKTVQRLRLTDGVEIDDVRGGGVLRAKTIVAMPEGKRVELFHNVFMRTPELELEAERLELEAPARDDVHIRVIGKKKVTYRADGDLGPLGTAVRGDVVVTCRAPLTIRRQKNRLDVQMIRDVSIRIADKASMECRSLRAALVGGNLVELEAETDVSVEAPQGTLRGELLALKGKRLTLTGAPASLARDDKSSIRARKIVWNEGGSFSADGDVVAETAQSKAGAWTISCEKLEGIMDEEAQRPSRVEARGNVLARGPDGRSFRGDMLMYRGDKNVIELRGTPARAMQADAISFAAPALRATVRDGDVQTIETEGRATLVYRTKDNEIAEWRATFEGRAHFAGSTLRIEKGGALIGATAAGAKRLAGRAGRIFVELDEKRQPRRLRGDRGVELRSFGDRAAHVTAKRLDYDVGTKQVILREQARVTAAGWPRAVRFGKVVFLVLPDGVDLKRASEIEVFERRKPGK